jgi:hypothetical protein
LSHYILPEGLLRGKIPSSSLETSPSVWFAAAQIFLFNLLSVVIVFFGSLFNQKKSTQANYYSIGYTAFFALVAINAVTLGTWSFGMETQAPTLLVKITEMFNIVKRAGLWEILGQLFITCSIEHIGLVLTNYKKTVTRKLSDIRLSKAEVVFIVLGLGLMLAGALIESLSMMG